METTLCNSLKLFNVKNIFKMFKWKRKPIISQCSHIYVSQFRSFYGPDANLILENQLTDSSLIYITTALRGTWFNSLFSRPFRMTKTKEILICRYEHADSQRYFYKNILWTYAANLHKKVPTGEFTCKIISLSFHYTADCTTLFFLT